MVETREKVGNYFIKEKKDLKFIKSGCQLLDLILGGGWAIGRVGNIVGDESTGKSLLAIEASANFNKQFPKGRIFYHEVESAFDEGYASMLGMPVDDVIFVRDEIEEYDTIEGYFNFLKKMVLDKAKKEPTLYILDTQDFLTDKAEKERKIEDGTYALEKNKLLNSLYRQQIRSIEKAQVHLMVISQTRANIGVSFGRRWRVTGDGALKFAASQRIQLAELGKIKKIVNGDETVLGLRIKANCFKNKAGIGNKSCEFPIYTGFGIDSNEASLTYLKKCNKLQDLGIGEGYSYKDIQELSKDGLEDISKLELHINNPSSRTRSELKQLLCEKWDLRERSRKRSPGGIEEVAKQLRDIKNIELEQGIEKRVLNVWNKSILESLPKRRKYE